MENLNDINHLDPNDEGLKAVMGGRFHDATRAVEALASVAAAEKNGAPAAKPVKAAEEKPARKSNTVPAALWEPVKPDPNWLDRLQACAKSTGLFGALCALFFYWQQTGLMDPAAAMPSMCACCLLAGLSIGKHATK